MKIFRCNTAKVGNYITILLVLALVLLEGHCKAPDAVTVFQRGEGGYYCQKIPYLLLTSSGALIAFAEGRGRNGRSACDDFAVCRTGRTKTQFPSSFFVK
jgi:hypothetical protein